MESQQTQAIAEPPGLALYRIGVGHYFSHALALAAKLGVADCLKDGPRHYEDLAKATQTHGPSLNRVMRLLASVSIFEERENGNFALTPLGELLRTGVPGAMRSSAVRFAGIGIQDSWKELEYCVHTGEPAFRKNSPDGYAFYINRTVPTKKLRTRQKSGVFGFTRAISPACLCGCDRSCRGLYTDSVVGRLWS